MASVEVRLWPKAEATPAGRWVRLRGLSCRDGTARSTTRQPARRARRSHPRRRGLSKRHFRLVSATAPAKRISVCSECSPAVGTYASLSTIARAITGTAWNGPRFFEREVIGERVRDKIAASKRKGIWVGGPVPLGYRCIAKKLVVVPEEAEAVR